MLTGAKPRWSAFGKDAPYRPALLVGSAGLAFLSVYALVLALRPGESYLRFQSDIAYNIPTLGALALSIIPIRRSRGRERLGWLGFSVLLLAWLAGDLVYTYYDLFLGRETPFPGWADVAYYPGYLALIVAIPLLTLPEDRRQDRRWLIDAAVVVVVTGTISWNYLMAPILADGGDTLAVGVALGYPVLDLVLLTTLVATMYSAGDRFSPTALVVAVAVVCQIVADGAYSYAVTTAGYDPVGNPLELGWLATYLLLGIAFVLPAKAAEETRHVRPSLVGLALPYAAGVPLVVLLVFTTVRGEPHADLLAGALLATGLVLVRQFLTLRDGVAQLFRAANFDDLTGLANRRQLEDHLGRHLPRTTKNRPGALVLLGLDDFKAVNDSRGHGIGDDIIAQVARLLREQLPDDQQHVARLSGDEFAIFLKQANGAEAYRLTQQLLRTLRERPFVVGSGALVRLTASAGIAVVPEQGATPGELLAHAGVALYEAKVAGGDSVRLYDAASETQVLGEARLDWKGRIRKALEEDQFVLYAQPIQDLRSGEIAEYELLLRMVDETGELIPPSSFLGIAERSGLIQDVDRWVLRHAGRLLARHAQHGGQASLAVNLSAKAFQTNDLAQMIGGLLAAAGVEGSRLVLEITETAAISDLDRARQFITSLKRLGCRIALDDFGAGFSSFQHLKQLPVDYLKIDGSFVRNARADPADQHFIRAIVDLARALGKETVAEYVEDEATLQLVRELGVDYVQGDHIGKPAPADDVLAGGGAATTPMAA